MTISATLSFEQATVTRNGSSQKVTKIGFANASISKDATLPGTNNPQPGSHRRPGRPDRLQQRRRRGDHGQCRHRPVPAVHRQGQRRSPDQHHARRGGLHGDGRSTPVQIKAPAPATSGGTYFAFVVQNLDFNFHDMLEIRGDFQIDNQGGFHGSHLEVFVGKGPSKINGVDNPDAIGVLIKDATIDFQRLGTGPDFLFALHVTGTVALLGLDGLAISGTVDFKINTNTGSTPTDLGSGGSAVSVTPQTYSLVVRNLQLGVAGVLADRRHPGHLPPAQRHPRPGHRRRQPPCHGERDEHRPAGRLRRVHHRPGHGLPALRLQGQLVRPVPGRHQLEPGASRRAEHAAPGALPDHRPRVAGQPGPGPLRRLRQGRRRHHPGRVQRQEPGRFHARTSITDADAEFEVLDQRHQGHRPHTGDTACCRRSDQHLGLRLHRR